MSAASPIDYGLLRQIVYRFSQNVLDSSRDYLFAPRLSKLLRNRGLTHLEELVQLLRLRKDLELERSVAEAMTINETSFFRDGRPFELLRTEVIPGLIEARRMQRSLRFWSAACSTGQEAYSVAMLLREHFPNLGHWNLRIDGTDFCSAIVERARKGRYHRIEMNRGLPARHIIRFFDHCGEDWVVKPEIHQLCHFRAANLCEPLPFTERFDVIFLRNVMLYFSQDARRALLRNVHRLLAPEGFLFLGSAEQPADPSLWTSVLAGGTCHFRPR
ncbi:MAG TPA: protein-glutamate O-methyltransferase CheR [Terracidiphilus sp.]|jgi:chemotaxis protein methyltransferase CheR|nr:protein-glutamate O-methyltransferase CheR [Terracidiphilus sp.]